MSNTLHITQENKISHERGAYECRKDNKKLQAYRPAQEERQIELIASSAWPSWFREVYCEFASLWHCISKSHTTFAFSKESKWTTRTWTFCTKWVDIFLNSVSMKQLISDFPGRLRRSHKRIQQWSSMSSSNRLFSYWAKNLPKGVWNTSNIEKFQNRIHQQIEELQICLLEELPKQGTAFRCRC